MDSARLREAAARTVRGPQSWLSQAFIIMRRALGASGAPCRDMAQRISNLSKRMHEGVDRALGGMQVRHESCLSSCRWASVQVSRARARASGGFRRSRGVALGGFGSAEAHGAAEPRRLDRPARAGPETSLPCRPTSSQATLPRRLRCSSSRGSTILLLQKLLAARALVMGVALQSLISAWPLKA
jgi:hypothetical protein